MKVLLFIDNLGSGGAQRQLVNLALLLKEHSIDVEILCYHHADFYAHFLIENKIKIHWITPSSFIMRMLQIRKFIRKNNFSAVISFLDTPDFINCFSGIGGHSWKIITSERSAQEKNLLTKKGKIFAFFKRFSDHIVCNSQNARTMWLNHYPHLEKKLTVIYNIVKTPHIQNKYVPRKNGKLNIVVAASYQELKNPINVIKAINKLGEHQSKITLNWYGSTKADSHSLELFNHALSLIELNNLKNVVFLHEETKNITDLMNEADVVGLFSRVEGLPNAIAEGMSLAKPIIMSRVSDFTTFVDDANGVFCDWDNVDSIKNALQSMIEKSNQELIILGENSKAKAELLFGSESNLSKWLKIL